MKIFSVIFLVFAVLLSGCASPRSWQYNADNYSRRQPLLAKKVAVPPFQDSRPTQNTAAVLMYLVPIMPFGWADYSAPEVGGIKMSGFGVWLFKPTEDLAKAAADELNASNLFKEAFFTQRPTDGDLVFRGNIKSTLYYWRILSYGLSVYGPALHFFGFPAGTIYNELTVEFSLEEQGSGLSLWKKSYNLTYDRSPYWFYSLPTDFMYDDLFKRMMRDVIKDLEGGIK